MRPLGLVFIVCAVVDAVVLVRAAVRDRNLTAERRHTKGWYALVIFIIVLALVMVAING